MMVNIHQVTERCCGASTTASKRLHPGWEAASAASGRGRPCQLCGQRGGAGESSEMGESLLLLGAIVVECSASLGEHSDL
ncbi:hypothetical protein PAMP_016812 [Pampus punctatissimus]